MTSPSRPVPLLTVDIGNTSCHWGVFIDTTLERQGHLPTKRLGVHLPPLLRKLQAGLGPETGLVLASVVPTATTVLRQCLHKQGWPPHPFQLTHADCPRFGLPLRIDEPAQLGQDRMAAALGALDRYPVPAIVLDLGTAITCDLVTSHGYEGGMIAPGLAVMTSYLHDKTALLPRLDAADLTIPTGLGRNTLSQMKLGVTTGYAGMVEALLSRVEDELAARGERPATILATGGTAVFLPPNPRRSIVWEPNLTLLGLAAAWRKWRTEPAP